MKFALKEFVVIVILSCILLIFPQEISHAGRGSTTNMDTLMNQFEAEDKTDDKVYEDLTTVIGKILGVLQVLTALISVIIFASLGFNYLVATPADVKEDMKKRMLPIIIGLIMTFSAVTIARFIMKAMNIT